MVPLLTFLLAEIYRSQNILCSFDFPMVNVNNNRNNSSFNVLTRGTESDLTSGVWINITSN